MKLFSLTRALLLFMLAFFCLPTESRAQDNRIAVSVEQQSGRFLALFNGIDLDGWDGDKRFWKVVDGEIVGQTSADNKASHNTFLIRSGETYGDFELRFSYQVSGFNSGVQYRSVAKSDYLVSGYQADFEARWHEDGMRDKYSGMFFEENGRMFLAQRGQAVIVRPGKKMKRPDIEVIADLGDEKELERSIKRDDWNDYVIIANGFQFTHIINGKVMAIGFDEDVQARREDGVIAFQLHSGPPMKIRLKDIRIREL